MDSIINEAINYHTSNKIPFTKSIFRMYSKNYFDVVNNARKLYENGELSYFDLWDIDLFESDIGKVGRFKGRNVPLDIPIPIKEAKYKGEDVELNKPSRNSDGKKFKVYVKDPETGNIKKVTFGAEGGGQNLSVKLDDPEAREQFKDRHNCEEKNDKTTPGYWSCRLPRYADSLGLSGGGQWW